MIDARLIAKHDRKAFIELRRAFQKRRATFPKDLTPVHPSNYADLTSGLNAAPSECWLSREFLVMIFTLPDQPVRLSVARVDLQNDGSWRDGITWDELQEVKAQVGFRECCAVEIYPAANDVVNVANLRHLWIVQEPDFVWKKKEVQP